MRNLLFQVLEPTVFPRDGSFAEDLQLQKIWSFGVTFWLKIWFSGSWGD